MTTNQDVRSPAGDMPSRLSNILNSKYVLERRLGGGGMAEVFLARTVGVEGFSRPVAIKRVLPGFSENPQFARMFISEAQLTSRLQHSNIVSVFDFDRDSENQLFLVMELVDGTDLSGLLATGPLPFSLVIYLAIEILRGLDYAHEMPINADGVQGVVHRDISPHNVLLSWEGTLKVSDFGIAKARAASNATASEIIKGKPAYMSPEQARGRPLDGRSDLFAVGVMLFEMLCLRPLFAGNTLEDILAQLLFDRIPAPHELRPEVPEDLSRAVTSLLARDRELRTPSASAAIAALVACADYPKDGREELITTLSQRFAGRAPVRARDVAHLSPTDQTLVVRSAAPPVAAPARRTITASGDHPRPGPNGEFFDIYLPPDRRRRWPWVILASLLMVGGAAGALVARERSPNPTAIKRPMADEATPTTPSGPAGPDVTVTTPRSPQPSRPPATDGNADTSASSAPTGPGSAPGRDHAPPSHVPVPRIQAPAPKSDGIREIHL